MRGCDGWAVGMGRWGRVGGAFEVVPWKAAGLCGRGCVVGLTRCVAPWNLAGRSRGVRQLAS